MTGPSGRRAPPLQSLREGLEGNPLDVLTKLFPADYSTEAKRVTPKQMVYMFLYESIEVSLFTSFLYQVIFLLPELTLSSFSA
jgi:hypothetical protein